MSLTWGSVSDATGYSVSRDGTTILANQNVTSHTDNGPNDLGLEPLTSYCYQVQAHNAAGDSEPSAETCVMTESDELPPPPPPLLATPSFTSTSSTADSVSLTWGSVSDATGYSVSRDGTTILANQNVTSHTDNGPNGQGLEPLRTYNYRVRAHNAGGDSNWSSPPTGVTTESDSVSVTGQVAIQRMSPTPVGGWTLSLRYVPAGGTPIEPTYRFFKLEDIETTWQYTSPVVGTVASQTRELGRIAYRLTRAGGESIEVGFRPTGSSSIKLPTPNRYITYSNMVLGRWYNSSSFTYTLPANAGARSDPAEFAGRLANALAPDDVACGDCIETDGELEPATDETT